MLTSNSRKAVDRINTLVRTTNATDFIVRNFARDVLVLTSSFEHCYYHEFEVHFLGVAYIELPIYGLSMPRFSVASEAMRNTFSHLGFDANEILFEIRNDSDLDEGQKFYVAAHEIKVSEGMVYYHQHKNLKAGEQIAEWVENNE